MLGYIISNKENINFEKHDIQTFDILHKTDLNIFVVVFINTNIKSILYKNNIIFNASSHGDIEVLEWYKNSGYEFKYDEWAINYASKYGCIRVLEWFKNSGYEFKYCKNAIIFASENGNIQVLEWFKNSGYKFKYTRDTFKYICYKRREKVLYWWLKNIHVKKIIKNVDYLKFIKTIKYKTKNNYMKGYNKN